MAATIPAYQHLLDVFVGYRSALARVPWASSIRAEGRRLLAAVDQVIADLRVVVRASDFYEWLDASIPLLQDTTHYADERDAVERLLGIK